MLFSYVKNWIPHILWAPTDDANDPIWEVGITCQSNFLPIMSTLRSQVVINSHKSKYCVIVAS